MKVRTTLLLGAGAISALVAGVAAPAGAAQRAPAPSCTDYALRGTVTSGPDNGNGIAGDLCIGATVTGTVFPSNLAFNTTAPSTMLRTAGLPVRGVMFLGLIAFGGAETVQTAPLTGTAAPQFGAPAGSETRFILAFGRVEEQQRATLAPDTLGQQSPSYSGNFFGLRAGDAGTWTASPSFLAN
jgi:hypothetical protein